MNKKYTTVDAHMIGDLYNVDWAKYDIEEFRMGLEVEREHDDVTGGYLNSVVKIVLAHLNEKPNYYTLLKKVEEDAPANVAGSGAIAGLPPDQPPVHPKKRKFNLLKRTTIKN